MKKHNVNVESVNRSVCYAHDAGISIRRCYIQICASLFLFLYRRAGLRDVRPPVHDGSALASKENSHYTLDLITGMMNLR